jgi:NMD protein affecting ribosome stability and mRNA decay
MRKGDKRDPATALHRPSRGDEWNDAYQLRKKLPDPTACPRCGALYRDGRWTWGQVPLEAQPTECPACRRIADGYYGGLVTIQGTFALEHREEIEHLNRNLEEREKANHPLKRIMDILPDEGDGGICVTTTDGKLARSIGTALHRAYRGELEQARPDDQGPTRVRWTRE